MIASSPSAALSALILQGFDDENGCEVPSHMKILHTQRKTGVCGGHLHCSNLYLKSDSQK